MKECEGVPIHQGAAVTIVLQTLPKESLMTRDFVASVARALRGDTHDTVHTHNGADGPYVCENPRCTSPGL